MSHRTRRTRLRVLTSVAAAAALLGTSAVATATPAAAHPTSSRVATSADHGRTDFGFIAGTFVKDGSRFLKFDRAVMLTGAAAKRAKAAHGLDPNDGPDYYIQNDNPKLRVYRLAPAAKVYGSQVLAGSPQSRQVPMQRLLDHLAQRPSGSTYPAFTLTFDKNRVVKVSEQYLP